VPHVLRGLQRHGRAVHARGGVSRRGVARTHRRVGRRDCCCGADERPRVISGSRGSCRWCGGLPDVQGRLC
jgi:hypothetical protein